MGQGYTKCTLFLCNLQGRNPLNPRRKASMNNRHREIKIRVSEAEYEQLLQRKTKPRLAEWVRETCLNQKPAKRVSTVDPLLLYELNKIGVNLNQIARKVNHSKNNIEWLVEIIHIEQQLSSLLENDC